MLIIHTDGACFGNPGPMGIGIAVYKNGKLVKEISEYLGEGTNNIAEYSAVVAALLYAKSQKEKDVEIRSDSQLLVNQLNGKYKIKTPHLKELRAKIAEIQVGMKVKCVWVPREQNTIADKLSKEAIEKRQTLLSF